MKGLITSLRSALLTITVVMTLCLSSKAAVLFQDDFASSTGAWSGVDGSFAITGGAYSLSSGDIEPDTRAFVSAGTNSWRDYSVSVDFKLTSGLQPAILFRVQDFAAGTDHGHYYQFNFQNDGHADFYELNSPGGGTRHLTGVITTGYSLNSTHHLSVTIQGQTATGYFDGTPILTYNGFTNYTYGGIGLKSFGSSTLFDNVIVTDTDAPPVPTIANIVMVPRLTIQSDVGTTNQIQYSTDLGQTNWTVLTNLVTAASPYWFVDAASPPASIRFYRVINLEQINAPANMALIPAGSFTMGDTFGDGPSGELPLHTVNVSAFYMDKYEVTKALWDDVYNWATNNGYSFEYGALGKAASHPAHSMTWYDATKWCNARSEKEGRVPAYYANAAQTTVYRSGQADVDTSSVKWNAGYRLPTEAEWEKAARGGASGHRFPWTDGETITHGQANYNSDASYTYDISPTQGYHPTFNDGSGPFTSPVGYFASNGYGLYDMAGNVWEWCWDWNGSYSSGSQTDPRGPASGSGRMLRGGSYYGNAFHCRVARRDILNPTGRGNYIGFRSVLPSGQ